MKKIDYSYMTLPEGRDMAHKRIKQMEEFAFRATGKPFSELSQLQRLQVHVVLITGEMKRMTCNNWRKLHGLPMRRKKHDNTKRRT